MAKITLTIATEDDPIYNEGFVISTHKKAPEPEKEPKKTDGIPELTVPDDLDNMDVDPADGFRITADKARRKK